MLDKERVVASDAIARAAGVCTGMRRGGVLTLAPATVMHERDGAAEVNAVREVATGLLNLSPQVVIAEESTVLVDVSASLRLFGGIRSLRRTARRVADAIGVTATISVAPTGQAACLLARYNGGTALSHNSLSRTLADRHRMRDGRTTDAPATRGPEETVRNGIARPARPRQWRCSRSV